MTAIEGRTTCRAALQMLGARQISVVILHPVKDKIIGALSFGSFAPVTVTAVKA